MPTDRAALPLPSFTVRLPDDHFFDDELNLPNELDELDDFPLGDGTADTEATVYCPYCGEAVEIGLDPGGGPSQQYVEDCQVCCQPWRVSVFYGEDGQAEVSVTALDE
jgi:hypothetical protein